MQCKPRCIIFQNRVNDVLKLWLKLLTEPKTEVTLPSACDSLCRQQTASQLSFGRHKGRHLKQVDAGYLQWMLESFPDSSPWQKAATEALKLSREQQQHVRDLLAELKTCCMRRDLQWGRRIHDQAVQCGDDSNISVTMALIKMYAKCGSMAEARRLFESLQQPDVQSWTALLLGYADNGKGHIVLELFSRMKAQGCVPDCVTYVAVLKACASLATNGDARGKTECLKRGKNIHSEIGCHMDLHVENTLIDMYAKCGSMADARRVFDTIQRPHIVSWNALISGYAENGEGSVALDLFSRMKAGGVCAPNPVTYIAALKACTSLAVSGDAHGKEHGLEMGRNVHSEIGPHMDLYLQNTLIDLYSKCGSMVEARKTFDSIQKPTVVSWTALLMGYADNGEGQVALDLYSSMKNQGCVPDSVTYIAALKACTSLAVIGDGIRKEQALDSGRKIHSEIGCHLDLYLQNTLIDMYANCGSMVEARQVFDNMQKPDVVSWNALLSGYAENGEGQHALQLFSRMKAMRGCAPDCITYVAALKACTSLVVNGDESAKAHYLEVGRNIHLEAGWYVDLHVQNTLIDMYANCGSMVDARQVFAGIRKPDVVSWNVLLLGYAENGEGHVSLDLFFRMKAVPECTPNAITYIAVFKACMSTGALDLGRKFHLDIREFTSHVVTCLVDFYAKCGSMVEARAVFDRHSRAREISTWNALLAGYSTCGDAFSVFKLFEAMQDDGFRPNAVTFLSMLLCCSHAGLVEKARDYWKAMPAYEVTPNVLHYTCMVDALGRGNQLHEAMALLQQMLYVPDSVIWITLLGACRKCKNVHIGKWAFESLVDLDKTYASAYVVMANIYGSLGMWEEQEKVLKSRLFLLKPTE